MMHQAVLVLVLAICNAHCLVEVTDFQKYGKDAPQDKSIRDKYQGNLDDGSSLSIPISTEFKFFNESFTSLFVNINGGISFHSAISEYTPACAALGANMAMISPFWADVDLESSYGQIFYRESNETAVLDKAKVDIVKAFTDHRFDSLALNWAFVATWDSVPFYAVSNCLPGNTNLFNTFQMTLATNGVYSFAIFYYNKIQWTTGTASNAINCTGRGGHPARAGFDDGHGTFYIIPGSCTDEMLAVTARSSLGEAGKYVFQIDTVPHDGSTATMPTIHNTVGTDPTLVPTSPPVPTTTEDPEIGDLRLDVKDGINITTTLANEICPGLIERRALQQQCFEQWMIIDQQMIGAAKATKAHELEEISKVLNDVEEKLRSIKDDMDGKVTKAPPFTCPASNSEVHRKCGEAQRSLDRVDKLATTTCPLLIDYPALQKDCFGLWIRVDNDYTSLRETEALNGFDVIFNDSTTIEEALKKIRKDAKLDQ